MTRKTSYTLREVANMLGLDYEIVKKHAQRKVLLATKKKCKANIGAFKRAMSRQLFSVSRESLARYKIYIKLKYKPRA